MYNKRSHFSLVFIIATKAYELRHENDDVFPYQKLTFCLLKSLETPLFIRSPPFCLYLLVRTMNGIIGFE